MAYHVSTCSSQVSRHWRSVCGRGSDSRDRSRYTRLAPGWSGSRFFASGESTARDTG